MTSAITLENVSRHFRTTSGRVNALDGVNLEVPEGQLVALLGENGAGKTTTAKILSTLLYPSSGRASVFGHDVVREARRVRALTTAVFGGDRGLYPMLSGKENLRYFGAIHGVPARELRTKVPTMLDQAGLSAAAGRRVEGYSKGMRQRLHVAIGLLTRPRLLLLDEPTVGLDPNESARLRETVAGFPAQGTTVLLTSHNLLDVDRLAQRVVMIRAGRITQDLTLAQFRRLSGYDAVITAHLAPTEEPLGADLPPESTITREPDGVRVTVPVRQWTPGVLNDLARAFGDERILDLQVRPSTLDEAFATASADGTSGPAA